MVLGLPWTSFEPQICVEQPRTVIVPEKLPGWVGGSGVIVMRPVVDPVMTKVWVKPLPVCEVATKTVPLLTITLTDCAAGVAPAWVAEKLTELAEIE